MTSEIVISSEPVTLVGGASISHRLLKSSLSLAPRLVAADSGADTALDAGEVPEAVIGDMDSLSASGFAMLPTDRLHRIEEQDSTDFDKALRNIKAPLVLAVGFLGDRLDHQLAALHVLAKYPERPCVLIDNDTLVFLCPPEIKLPTKSGQVVSLFPLGRVTGTSSGLKWPINDIEFHPSERLGTSNEAVGPLILEMDAPHMIVMIPRSLLEPVIEAFMSAPRSARWIARAGI